MSKRKTLKELHNGGEDNPTAPTGGSWPRYVHRLNRARHAARVFAVAHPEVRDVALFAAERNGFNGQNIVRSSAVDLTALKVLSDKLRDLGCEDQDIHDLILCVAHPIDWMSVIECILMPDRLI